MAGHASRSSRFSAFLTSFAVQAGYNYDGFQNLGFAASLLPALNDIYEDDRERNEAFRSHLEFFCAHPYLATYTVGAVIKAEEERAASSPDSMGDEELARFKQASGSVLGSLGDQFFWAGLRPLAAIAGIIAFLLSPLYGILTFLVLYNVPHVLARAEGMRMGYESGPGMLPAVGGERGARAILWVKRLGALTLGILVPLTIAHPKTPDTVEGTLLVAAAAAAGWLLLRRRARQLPSLLSLVVLVALYCILT